LQIIQYKSDPRTIGYYEQHYSEDDFIKDLSEIVDPNINADLTKGMLYISYVSYIYLNNLSEHYIFDLKQNPKIIEKKYFFKWLNKNKPENYIYPKYYISLKINSKFLSEIKKLKNLSGVYSFWLNNGTLLYIGMSSNLKERILTSFRTRFNKYTKDISLRYISTKSLSNAAVLEVYLICKYKPILNKLSKYKDKLGIEIKNPPSLSKSIKCNNIRHIKINKP